MKNQHVQVEPGTQVHTNTCHKDNFDVSPDTQVSKLKRATSWHT